LWHPKAAIDLGLRYDLCKRLDGMLSLTCMHFEVTGCNPNKRDLPATASAVHELAGGSFPGEVAAVFASNRVDLDPN